MRVFTSNSIMNAASVGLDEQSADECEDGVELGESGVDEGLGHHIVALGYTLDTCGADLALTDSGEHAAETDESTDTEDESAVGSYSTHEGEEGHEAINTLGGRQS